MFQSREMADFLRLTKIAVINIGIGWKRIYFFDISKCIECLK